MGWQSEFCSDMVSQIQRDPSRKTPHKLPVCLRQQGWSPVLWYVSLFLSSSANFYSLSSPRTWSCVFPSWFFITYKNSANCCSDSRHLAPFPVPSGFFHFSKMFAAFSVSHSGVRFLFCFCFLNLKSTDTAKRKNSLDLPLNFDKVVHQVTQAG